MIARLIIIVVAALLSFYALLTAAASLPVDQRPLRLQFLWPYHPVLLTDRVMAEVGISAAAGRTLKPETRGRLQRLARLAPLAVEPFLVEGALAQVGHRDSLAESMYLEARRRDPRSAAARYFLGSRYLATGRTAEGLSEIAMVSRIVPDAQAEFVRALADFARSSGSVSQLKRFFETSRQTEEDVLAVLATDANNIDLVLKLASLQPPRHGQTFPTWHTLLVEKLVETGQPVRAHAVWSRLTRNSASRTLFNPRFQLDPAAPPFNWTFNSGRAGVAEPTKEGLKIVYYGRDDAVFASQLLVLPSSTYRLSSSTRGIDPITGLVWSLTCLPSKQKIVVLALAAPGNTPANTQFSIAGSDCDAQLLELAAIGTEGAQTIVLTVPKLDLIKVRGQ